MSTAYCVTDGSHLPDIKVGGVAGTIAVKGSQPLEFSGLISNAGDSTVIEFLAIKKAMNIIKKMNIDGAGIKHVVFATDSQNIVFANDPDTALKEHPDKKYYVGTAKRYNNLITQLQNIAKQAGVTYDIFKVKSHVPDEQANEIEKIHNKMDLAAKIPMRRAFDAIDLKSLRKGKSFTVFVPADMSEETFDKVKRVALKLFHQGYTAKVLLEKGASNPVQKAFVAFQEFHGFDRKKFGQVSHLVTDAVDPEDGDFERPITGLNLSRARQWIKLEGKYVNEWELKGLEGALMNDIIESTLGRSYPQHKVLMDEYKGKLTGSASEFILHHGEEGKMPQHDAMMRRAVKVAKLERRLVSQFLQQDLEKDMADALRP